MAGRKKSRQEIEEDDIAAVVTQTALQRERAKSTDLVLYLDDSAEGGPVIMALVVPDLERCQCEWPDQTIITFGPKPIVRCDTKPTVVAFQKRDPEADDTTGAISLCDEHKVMIEHMYPGQCYFRRITSEKKIGDFA